MLWPFDESYKSIICLVESNSDASEAGISMSIC